MSTERISGKKRTWFYIIALAIPILFFLLLEILLRVGGYGFDYPLFSEIEGFEHYQYPREDVAARYFHTTGIHPGIPFDSFRSEKDEATFRIFVQGGSTAAGFPYYYGGSFPDMLEQRLQQTFPDRNIEVVNTAMAAVNSYTLYDFVGEIIEQEPDAILIYAGHNEFYGALGVGSTESLGSSPGLIRMYLRLDDLRVVQLLRNSIAKIAGAFSNREAGEIPGGTLMERVVKDQSIPYGSRKFLKGLNQFESNLDAILRRYRRAGIPVYISTIASNERDHPPFISNEAVHSLDSWDETRQRIAALVLDDSVSSGIALLDRVIRRDTTHAGARFVRARLLEQVGSINAAEREYRIARDMDQLRFRASSDINKIISRVAEEHGAVVVDAYSALVQNEGARVVSQEVMTEHLHPNINGYFLIADAFYRSMQEHRLIAEDWDAANDIADARGELLITPLDRMVGHLRVTRLTSSWPFKPRGTIDNSLDTLTGRNELENLALSLFRDETTRREALDKLRTSYVARGQNLNALRVTYAIIQRYPFLHRPYFEAGSLLAAMGRFDEAIVYAEASLERQESAEGFRLLGSVQLQQEINEEGTANLERSLALEPRNEQALYNAAGGYAKMGQKARCVELIEQLLAISPNHPGALSLLATLGSNREG